MSGQRVLVVLVVVVGVVAGAAIVLLGPPGAERARQLDRRRVEGLELVSRSIETYVTRHKRLPSSLDELSAEPGLRMAVDPVVGTPYEYRALDAKHYELCASFERSSDDTQLQPWSHGPGRQCFRRDVSTIR